MLTTLNGMFLEPKPHRVNFIKENKKRVKDISSMVYQNNMMSRIDITRTRSSQTEVSQTPSEYSTVFKENKKTSSSCKLNNRGSVAVFVHDKKEKGNISNMSISAGQTSSQNLKVKSSQKMNIQKNQSCQTIDPRRCDQLYHDGVIKYPSSKVLQELAEIEKQKANRLDAHIKKEYFKRNKVKQKNPKKISLAKLTINKNGKGDEVEDVQSSTSEEDRECEKQKEPEPESAPEPVMVPKVTKPAPSPFLRAAEIIRKTTEDINYNAKPQIPSDNNPNNRGDSKGFKKVSKKLSREEEILKTVLDPQCPPGHIPLPDTERKKTLHMLRVSHAELVREMNLLPVRTDTLRVRQKKIQLENQLSKIEEGIKVFNKSKVYVKIEE